MKIIMGSEHPYFVVLNKFTCFFLLISYGLITISLLPVSYALQLGPNSSSPGCVNRISGHRKLPCDFKLRLLLAYNKLRDRIAGGLVPNHPRIGNMLRSKWLISAEVYADKRASQCDPTALYESNVTLNNPDNEQLAYTCEFIFLNKLFKDWSFHELLDFLLDASFENNYFLDFDKNERFQRVSVEAFGCSIALDTVGVDMIRSFMGCGFCTSNTAAVKVIYGDPCSRCNLTPAENDFIPSACDAFFRNLCTVEDNTRADPFTHQSQFVRETSCDADYFLVSSLFHEKEIPSKVMPPNLRLFMKVTYVLPLITITLLVYYMIIIKGRRLFDLKLPIRLSTIRKLV